MIETFINIVGLGALAVIIFWAVVGYFATQKENVESTEVPKQITEVAAEVVTDDAASRKAKLQKMVKDAKAAKAVADAKATADAKAAKAAADAKVAEAPKAPKETKRFGKIKILSKAAKEIESTKAPKKLRIVAKSTGNIIEVRGGRTELKGLLGKIQTVNCNITRETRHGRQLLTNIKFGNYHVDHTWMKEWELNHLKVGNHNLDLKVTKYKGSVKGEDKYGFQIVKNWVK